MLAQVVTGQEQRNTPQPLRGVKCPLPPSVAFKVASENEDTFEVEFEACPRSVALEEVVHPLTKDLQDRLANIKTLENVVYSSFRTNNTALLTEVADRLMQFHREYGVTKEQAANMELFFREHTALVAVNAASSGEMRTFPAAGSESSSVPATQSSRKVKNITRAGWPSTTSYQKRPPLNIGRERTIQASATADSQKQSSSSCPDTISQSFSLCQTVLSMRFTSRVTLIYSLPSA